MYASPAPNIPLAPLPMPQCLCLISCWFVLQGGRLFTSGKAFNDLWRYDAASQNWGIWRGNTRAYCQPATAGLALLWLSPNVLFLHC